MKVGLVSFHNAYNYGACLQAYALQEAVSGLGATCEYINYINQRRADGYRMFSRIKSALKKKDIKGAIKSVVGAPFVWSRGRKFKRFYRENLLMTTRVYHSCDEASALEGKYDRFVVGSDQVWNAEHNGNDGAYFLDFIKDRGRKISYASSFGMDSLPDELRSWYAKGLDGIGCLSTREEAGVRIIREVCGREAHLVLDPVFLLQKNEWMRFVDTAKPAGDYTLYYLNAPFNLRDIELVTGVQDHEQHVLSASVSIKDFLQRGRKVTFALSPQEFLQEIHDANLVVTTSFHCLAFSILFHKQFIAILSGDDGRDERLLNLLHITGLENRIFSRTMTKEQVETCIDYEEVERRLSPFRKYSREYLRLALFLGAEGIDTLIEPQPEIKKIMPIEVCPWEKCTGCGVCSLSCSTNAISMTEDPDGFYRPTIDPLACVCCGRCAQICPSNNPHLRCDKQTFYAMKQPDKVRAVSSSGGAFRALAWAVLKQGGAVAASAMDSSWNMAHTLAESPEGVEQQGHTYYVQGKAWHIYPEIAQRLREGQKTLFVGTPCQVAGLRAYLNRNESNLITCDILCHGVPSPKAFHSFIQYLQNKGQLTDLNHRDKDIGWKGYCVSAEIDGKKYRNAGWLKAYNVMFSHGLINRDSCFSCPYSNYNRPSDLTIGDWWGVEKYHKEMIDRLGISLVIANTERGRMLLSLASDGAELIEVKKDETLQNSLLKPMKKPIQRIACLSAIESSYMEAAKTYGEWNVKGYGKELLRQIVLKCEGF